MAKEEKGVIRTISKKHFQNAEEITWNTTKGGTDLYSGKNMEVYGKKGGVVLGDYKQPEKKIFTNKNLSSFTDINCIVHFRPKTTWQGEDYGFDWMRIDDTNNKFGDKKPYEDIVGYYDKYPSSDANAIFTKNATLYTSLKSQYTNYDIPWLLDSANQPKQYFVSWLSVYPNKEVILSLNILVHKTKRVRSTATSPEVPAKLLAPATLRIAYEHEFFEIKFAGIAGRAIDDAEVIKNEAMHYTDITIDQQEDYKLNDRLSIKCIKALPQIKNLRVLADGKECGYLKVMPNDNINYKKLSIICVKVWTNINGVKKGIIKGKNEITKYLAQALIEPVYTDVVMDLTKTHTVPEQPNTTLQQGGLTNILSSANGSIGFRHGGQVLFNGSYLDSLEYMLAEFADRFTKTDGTSIYPNCIKIFYLDEFCFYEASDGVTVLTIGGRGAKAKDAAIIFKDISATDLAHEVFHSIGLQHSFGTGVADVSNYAYEYKKTENIMDYAHLEGHAKYSTWKWQWDILKANNLLTNTQ